jgi:hypothetical protein
MVCQEDVMALIYRAANHFFALSTPWKIASIYISSMPVLGGLSATGDSDYLYSAIVWTVAILVWSITSGMVALFVGVWAGVRAYIRTNNKAVAWVAGMAVAAPIAAAHLAIEHIPEIGWRAAKISKAVIGY